MLQNHNLTKLSNCTKGNNHIKSLTNGFISLLIIVCTTFTACSNDEDSPLNNIPEEDLTLDKYNPWDNVANGVYAVSKDGLPILLENADESCIGAALITDNQKIMIEKFGQANTTIIEEACIQDKAANILYHGFYWGPNFSDVEGIDNINSKEEAIMDFKGKEHTAAIIATPDTDNQTKYANMGTYCKLFNEAQTEHKDWYIPALGQLYEISLNRIEMNEIFTAIKGTIISDHADLWSSSEKNDGYAYMINVYYNTVGIFNKTIGLWNVRFIRDLSIKK